MTSSEPTPDSQDPSDGLKELKNFYNQRTLNLSNFPPSLYSRYSNNRGPLHKPRSAYSNSTSKSLNVLRSALQKKINEDIKQVMQKYIEIYFRPAIANLRKNFGNNTVSDHHVQAVSMQILEEAKKMYASQSSGTSKVNNTGNSSDIFEPSVCIATEDYETTTCNSKRKVAVDTKSDNDSNSPNQSQIRASVAKKQKTGQVLGRPKGLCRTHTPSNGIDNTKREGPRWDPDRLSTETRFVLGSKANKALGFGATRGRLYTKHADLFRYIGDAEDKEWLHKHGLMPPAGGRAYLIIKQDIEDLLISDEYKNAPGIEADCMGEGFTVPEYMIGKMKLLMHTMRSKGGTGETQVSTVEADNS